MSVLKVNSLSIIRPNILISYERQMSLPVLYGRCIKCTSLYFLFLVIIYCGTGFNRVLTPFASFGLGLVLAFWQDQDQDRLILARPTPDCLPNSSNTKTKTDCLILATPRLTV